MSTTSPSPQRTSSRTAEAVPPKYIKPKLRMKRAKKQARFLSLFKELGRISLVCRKLRSTPGDHYFWLRTDPDYKERFEAVQRTVTAPSYKKPGATLRNEVRRRPQQHAFLTALQRFHQFTPAAEAAHITRSTHDRWLRVDPWYARQFNRLKRDILSDSQRVRLPHTRNVPIPVGLGSVAQRREELSRLKPAGKKNRAMGHGSIHIFTRSTAITWYDVQGERHYENLGPISVMEANERLAQRTEADHVKRQQSRELAKTFLRSGTAPATSPARRRGRPPMLTNEQKQKERTAAATLKPRKWCEVRDALGIPLTSRVEKYGTWVNAYDSGDLETRKYLSIQKAPSRK